MNEKRGGVLDNPIVKRWINQKLGALVLATALLESGSIDSLHWSMVAAAYLILEGVSEAAEHISKKGEQVWRVPEDE